MELNPGITVLALPVTEGNGWDEPQPMTLEETLEVLDGFFQEINEAGGDPVFYFRRKVSVDAPYGYMGNYMESTRDFVIVKKG